ncbi:SDR family NAD(P)-dependent oxidoreductase, partial [Pseudomonas sp. SIMBA_059]
VDGTALELSRIEASETVAPLDHSASGTEREAPNSGASVKGPLRGKVVVVTGASSGIGRAAAHAFACKGARLVLAARDEEALFDVLDECTDCGTDAIAITTDVTRNDQV